MQTFVFFIAITVLLVSLTTAYWGRSEMGGETHKLLSKSSQAGGR